jgi:hypothetical protein
MAYKIEQNQVKGVGYGLQRHYYVNIIKSGGIQLSSLYCSLLSGIFS